MNIKSLFITSVAISILLFSASTAAGKTIYVDDTAPGANNGTSWTNAYKFLQDALADANSSSKPVEIRVSQGIYKPDRSSAEPNGSGDRAATFQLINGVTLKGGYAGFSQPDPNVRDIDKYKTILSGSGLIYQVITITGADDTTLLDGVTITGGNADQYPHYYGGGVLVESGSPLISNCAFTGNKAVNGGGLCIWTNATVINCTFSGNTATYGGGMSTGSETPVATRVTNCVFSGNSATYYGGAMICGDAIVTNCTFTGNSSGNEGGAAAADCAHPTFYQCTFSGNTADERGGALYNWEGDWTIIQCTFIANSASFGGAISQGDTDSVIVGCRFIGNAASMGGGIANHGYSDPTLANCTFSSNSAEFGAGFYNTTGSAPGFVNCTFAKNLATNRGAGILSFSNYDFSPVLTNCIFWDNRDSTDAGQSAQISYEDGTPIVNYCSVQGWTGELGGVGNIGADPCFADPNNGDYHLKSQAGRWDANEGGWTKDDVTSLCIDAGNPASPIGLEPFPNGGRINMGAYGGTAEASKSYFGEPPCQSIVAGDINGDCIVNLKDFAIMAAHWLAENNP